MRENKTCFHKELEQMSTAQLDDILQAELQKDQPDEHVVLPILEVLEKREEGIVSEISPSSRTAWDRFTGSIAQAKPRKSPLKWISGVAAAAAVVCLVLLMIPQGAEADTLFDRLVRITDSVLQFFDPDRDPGDIQREFVFETDNPGLQQLHDKLAELGVTEPVVPMWLPEGYDLEELKVASMRGSIKVHAYFSNGENAVMIQYKLVAAATTTQYEVKNRKAEVYESFGVYHTIAENEKELSAVWEKSGVECLLAGDMKREVLCTIIDSIYRREP